MVPEVGHNEFVVLRVHKNAVRIPDARPGAFQNASGSHVAIIAGAEDKDFMRDWVGNVNFLVLHIDRNMGRPIQSGFRTLDHSQRRGIPGRLQGIYVDRRVMKFPGAGNQIQNSAWNFPGRGAG